MVHGPEAAAERSEQRAAAELLASLMDCLVVLPTHIL
jgi:hypothetical protein